VKCTRCQRDNEPDAAFCTQCGGRLERLCPQCQTANVGDARYCKRCGAVLEPALPPTASLSIDPTGPRSYTPKHLAEKILGSRGALEGERKQVTVLFVDVSGFTSLSERMDPEDVHRLMTRAFELMLEEVHRYEGTVNQFLGDGIMALFGAPIAHEDHAVRACHAALGIQKALAIYQDHLAAKAGITFYVRQGLNTGLVVVGSIGKDLRMDYTAVGDTTNVAARMQQAADRGRIVVAEATQRLVGGYFHTRPLGGLTLKGKSEPVRAWEVISARTARTRLDVEAERGLTPYVGRDRELRILHESFEKAKAGAGQVVFVIGEPGIGKSRLLLEFRRQLGNASTWVEGRSMSFGRSIAFHPLIDLLRRTFRLEETDDETAIIEKIERGVVRLGEDLRITLPYLRYLLAVSPGDAAVQSMDPQLRRAEVFSAVRRLLLRAAEIRPQVVVYEDVHWMDQATEEYLGHMADVIATSRVLMILTYRPGYASPFGDRSYYTRLALTALSTEASAQMAQAMLAAEQLPYALQALIARKAEGNPFFVEEVMKSLQEIGAIRLEDGRYVITRVLDELVVPDTIQDVIMARIDRLAEAPKKTLQLASVIGREFTRRLLDRISDIRGQSEEFLRDLKAIELIYEKNAFPELSYMFKHALTHDVAYNSLLVQRRKELHHAIARAVEELYADRLAEHYEVLAHHFSRAEEWSRALAYLCKAAEKASQGCATHEALTLYAQALDAASHLPEGESATAVKAIHQARADIYMVKSEFTRAREEGERALAIARRMHDDATAATALGGMAFASVFGHAFEAAVAYAKEAVAIGQAAGVKAAVARGHFVTGWVHAVHGRHEEALREVNKTLAISRSGGDPFHLALTVCLLGEFKNFRGEFVEASALQSEALQIAEAHNLVFPMLYGYFAEGITRTGMGDYPSARYHLEEGRALAAKVGDEIWVHRMLNCLGWYYIELQDLDRATALNREGAAGARERGDPETAANAEANLGDIFIARGELSLAQEVLDGVHHAVKDPAVSAWQKWRYSMHVFASLAEVWLARGDLRQARNSADQCLEVATRTTSRKYLARGWRLRGEIALATRAWDEAQEAMGQALQFADTVGNPTELWKTHAALGRLHLERGRPDAAWTAHRAARHVLDRVQARIDDAALRRVFATALPIRELYRLSEPR
jgi:class 3 adenylate cyclase/tetratricopeptide (TPR) repeat protein